MYANHKELFGESKSEVFPLLTKILDANDWLSVQVHPDDAYALAYEGELGKTECWYILSAEENAEIIYGHHASSKEELQQMIENRSWDKLLRRVKVKAGDFFYVPSGTMHAIGKGIMILETQQSSDTTYRVYDFDRVDDNGNKRDLHLLQSLDVTVIGEVQNSHPDTIQVDHLSHTVLVSTEFFTVYHWLINDNVNMTKFAPYLLVSVLGGFGSIEFEETMHTLTKGMHFIIPNNVDDWKFSGKLDLIVSHI